MSTRLEKIKEAIKGTTAEIKAIRKVEEELNVRKDKLAAIVGLACEQLPKFTGVDEDADEEELDELRDQIESFAWAIGQTWSGNWESGEGWEPGQRPEFWVPSVC